MLTISYTLWHHNNITAEAWQIGGNAKLAVHPGMMALALVGPSKHTHAQAHTHPSPQTSS